jgi:hypothetical protein
VLGFSVLMFGVAYAIVAVPDWLPFLLARDKSRCVGWLRSKHEPIGVSAVLPERQMNEGYRVPTYERHP